MKKVLCILFSICLFSVTMYAQGISGGAKLGLNFADQTFSGSGGFSSPGIKPGIHAGGYLTIMISKHLGLQPELLFSGQGYKNGSATIKLNYITIPVLFRFNINNIISLHAGPQLGFLASAKQKISSSSTDIKNNYKSNDIGIAVGCTVDLPMGLNFTGRIVKGVSDVNDLNNSSYEARNLNIQLSVGYKLFGKK